MKNYLLLILTTILLSTQAKGAFFIKHQPKASTEIVIVTPESDANNAPVARAEVKTTRQPFYKKLLNKGTHYMPRGVYIFFSIIFLGWLAIGANDSWKGHAWLKALLLYLLLYFPGLIYTLWRMDVYYHKS
jgi:uncharacterized membrane protein YqaE (UPF0057 family)